MGKSKDNDQEKYRKEIVVALASNPAMVENPSVSDEAVAVAISERVALCVVAIVDKVNEELEEEW